MNADVLHRRMVVLMCFSALVAFSVGARFDLLPAVLAGGALLLAMAWQPSKELSTRMERVWVPVALFLVIRSTFLLWTSNADVVIPVVHLLLFLMCAEALRSVDARNDGRLYALSFSLMLAATAYRPGILFGVAFSAYAMSGTVALVVGHLRRTAADHGLEDYRVGQRLAGGTAALSMVILASAALVFLTFPRVSEAWAGRGGARTTSMVGFGEEVSLGEYGSRIRSNPRVVLRVEFPGGRPPRTTGLHWRGRSFDRFDGVRWSRSDGIRPSAGTARWYRAWTDSLIEQHIYATPLDARVLFTLHPVVDLQPHSRIYPLFDGVGDYVYWGSSAPVYSVLSAAAPPPPDSLRSATSEFMPDSAHYLQLPPLPDRIHALADSLAGHLETRYDRARAVQLWLQSRFRYTLDLPSTAEEATLDHFLFERMAGHCEYFSTAMVVLLRSLGIHARNVNGFLGGEWSEVGDYLVVTQNEAHSWVEVWFPGWGWVTFDPTPPAVLERGEAGGWSWPGRSLLDALQHRWSTWVLDYDLGLQAEILDRVVGDGERGGADTRADDDAPGAGRSWAWLWWVGLVAAAGGGLALARWARGSRLRPESRVYTKLLKTFRRAGFGGSHPVAPLHLVRELRRRQHPAAEPARRLVERYLRARFAGEGLAQADLARMTDDLRAARRRLRAARPSPRDRG